MPAKAPTITCGDKLHSVPNVRAAPIAARFFIYRIASLVVKLTYEIQNNAFHRSFRYETDRRY